MVLTSRGWQHFFIWSIAWAVATCSGVYNGRGPAVLPLSKKALRKSHFFPQQSCTTSVLNVTKSRQQLHTATLEWQQHCAGEVSSHRRAQRGGLHQPAHSQARRIQIASSKTLTNPHHKESLQLNVLFFSQNFPSHHLWEEHWGTFVKSWELGIGLCESMKA